VGLRKDVADTPGGNLGVETFPNRVDPWPGGYSGGNATVSEIVLNDGSQNANGAYSAGIGSGGADAGAGLSTLNYLVFKNGSYSIH
jgi:hypothetical protein